VGAAREGTHGGKSEVLCPAQYTRHVRPGMAVLAGSDPDTVTAYDRAHRRLALIVHASQPGTKVFDLSKFTSASGPVTTWTTEPESTARYEERHDLKLEGAVLKVTLPKDSVTTVQIDNVVE